MGLLPLTAPLATELRRRLLRRDSHPLTRRASMAHRSTRPLALRARGGLPSSFGGADFERHDRDRTDGLIFGWGPDNADNRSAEPAARAPAGNERERALKAPRAFPRSVPGRTGAAGRAARAYEHAVRACLWHGPLTRTQEEHLAHVAHDLGVPHPDAVRILRHVEEEAA